MGGLVVDGKEKKGKKRGEERRKIDPGRVEELAIPKERGSTEWAL